MSSARTEELVREGRPRPRAALTKAPEITVYFWLIKVLCTTVGETAADQVDRHLGVGLTYTSYLMTGLLVIALAVQLAVPGHVPAVYWAVVVLISVVGSLLTDNLTDSLGVPAGVAVAVLVLLLVATFARWYAAEQTLSIHTIHTRRREGFSWVTMLLAFALGAAAGDVLSEELALAPGVTGLVLGLMIAAVAIAWWKLRLDPIIAFWLAFVLTGPWGAALGDLAARPHRHGGLGLGTTGTSLLFLLGIGALVTYLGFTGRDRPRAGRPFEASAT